MPRLSHKTPKYRKHKASGQAFVEMNGRRHYLGPHGTKTSKSEYDRIVAEWLTNGRQPLVTADDGITIAELLVRYLRHVRKHYVKNNAATGEQAAILYAIKPLREMYGTTPAADFGPLRLEALRQRMIGRGWSRGTINRHVSRVRRLYRWAASKQIVPADIHQSLATLDGLRSGRTEAKESAPIMPVDDATVDATVEHLPAVVADMVRLQRLTGCRPAELCMMRPMDLDRSDNDVWRYKPESHKTEHHGRERVIFIGPQAQGILLRYLARDATDHCFRPSDSEAKRRAQQHRERRTPMSCGNIPGTNRKPRRKRAPGDRYTVDSYRRSIHRACDKADVPRWSPNRLRHAAATEVRRRFWLEAAQVMLGHSQANVTQVYAERDFALAARVAREVG